MTNTLLDHQFVPFDCRGNRLIAKPIGYSSALGQKMTLSTNSLTTTNSGNIIDSNNNPLRKNKYADNDIENSGSANDGVNADAGSLQESKRAGSFSVSPTTATVTATKTATMDGVGTTASSSHSPVCKNCHTSTTPLWRRDEHGAVLCNACGLFLKLHGRPRPISLKTDVIKSRNRKTLHQDVGTNGDKRRRDHSVPPPPPLGIQNSVVNNSELGGNFSNKLGKKRQKVISSSTTPYNHSLTVSGSLDSVNSESTTISSFNSSVTSGSLEMPNCSQDRNSLPQLSTLLGNVHSHNDHLHSIHLQNQSRAHSYVQPKIESHIQSGIRSLSGPPPQHYHQQPRKQSSVLLSPKSAPRYSPNVHSPLSNQMEGNATLIGINHIDVHSPNLAPIQRNSTTLKAPISQLLNGGKTSEQPIAAPVISSNSSALRASLATNIPSTSTTGCDLRKHQQQTQDSYSSYSYPLHLSPMSSTQRPHVGSIKKSVTAETLNNITPNNGSNITTTSSTYPLSSSQTMSNPPNDTQIPLSQVFQLQEEVIKLKTRLNELELITDLYKRHIFELDDRCKSLEIKLQMHN
ncbi:Gzf3p Ecym_6365 [Eremothecium cymbalariae DBVPG|uniref:GATA-type domain-containing protein n=1 Tax=Eremothecium cymbalariae (strain CBS 270.75 / DBVPG 7215 / KCTC 17166 / NRRL Y-17582) TaxID=931890 RepID=G8JUG1_ERECY|nr:hypothetical protein Ecym_6365 [Eremothecium cymbalariae DBVPG\